MQEAIQSGREESLEALLQSMTKAEQKTQLCASYEASYSPDNSGFRVRTSPLLYAAQCGNSGAFSALLRATREVLKPQVVQPKCLGSTLNIELSMNLPTNNSTPVRGSKRVYGRRGFAHTALSWHKLAVSPSTNLDSFSLVLHSCLYSISHLVTQLKAIMKAKDSTGRTVLAAAASSGKRGAFDTVLAGVKNELDPVEVLLISITSRV